MLAVLAGLACWGQSVSGVALLDDDGTGGSVSFRRTTSADAGTAPDAGLIVAPAYIAFAPVYRSSAYDGGQGLGAECAGVDVTTPDGGAVSINRSGVVWCTKADYSLVEVGANKPRVQYDKGNPNALALFLEGTPRTNIVLQNRDLSNAAWTKSASMTCAKTAAGADLAANAASTCTSSGANQTVLQGLTVASAQRNSSLYIKRRTGTGAIEVTRDNGTTWTAITGSLSSSIYKRVVSYESIGCMYGGCIVVPAMTAIAANPTVGVRIAASGDAVDIDLFQDETEDFPTSPITTAGSTVARGLEQASLTVASFTPRCVSWDSSRSGYEVSHSHGAVTVLADTSHVMQSYDLPHQSLVPNQGGLNVYFANGAATHAVANIGVNPSMGPVPHSYGNDGGTLYTESAAVVTTADSDVPPSANTVIYLGYAGPMQEPSRGGAILINNVRVDSTPGNCPASPMRALRPVSFHGDSIVAGSYSGAITAPSQLQSIIGRGVYNKGIPADNTAGCVSRFTSQVLGRNFASVVWLCGTNDFISCSNCGATFFEAARSGALAPAKAAGMGVIPVTVLPKASAAGWTQQMQDNIEQFNTALISWANASNGGLYVDGYGFLGATNPDGGYRMLSPTYDSNDGVHPNAAGATYLAQLVADAGFSAGVFP